MQDILERYRNAVNEVDLSTAIGRNKAIPLIDMAKRHKEFMEIAEEQGFLKSFKDSQ